MNNMRWWRIITALYFIPAGVHSLERDEPWSSGKCNPVGELVNNAPYEVNAYDWKPSYLFVLLS